MVLKYFCEENIRLVVVINGGDIGYNWDKPKPIFDKD
jgi:hypothetical protein